ncbi:MAG TPA: alpha/beta hydrolase, partial [Candidatus Saccharimonadia bacterium]|nr:alpha/beta hydrolase [Candidatus Saccharimonadia bacterium]
MNTRLRLRSLVPAAILVLLTSGLCAAPESIVLWPDGAPGSKGTRPEDTPRVDVYLPTAPSCGAGVVVLPGGGYGGLAADHEGKQIAQYFNRLGVTAFVCFYRLGSQGYHHPIEMNDAKRAVRWARANAEKYKIDKDRLGLIGFSAGGHLASTVGTLFDNGDPNAKDPIDKLSSRPDFLVLCYPVISMTDDFMHRGSRNNLLGDQKDNEELARELTNYRNVSPHTPPTFIFQTDEDTAVPAENAVQFYLALRKNKVPAEMHIYQRGPHGVGLHLGDPVLATWSQHLTDWLRNNGWLKPAKRAAVEGTVTINGTPGNWGTVIFTSDDPVAPIASARLMSGKFQLPARDGAVIGMNKLKVTFSTANL